MQDRLLRAAIDCFTRQGYSRTGVADITGPVGTSHGNFYRYFRSVDDALVAAATAPLRALAGASQPPAGANATSLDALVDWQRRFLLAYAPHRRIFAVLREAAAADRGSGFAGTMHELRSTFVATLEAWVRDVETQLGPDPDGATPAALAEVLGAMGEQVAHVHLGVVDGEPDLDAVLAAGRAMSLVCHRTVVAPRLAPHRADLA